MDTSEKSVLMNDIEDSMLFSNNDDISYLYQRIKSQKNNMDSDSDDEHLYKDEQEDTKYNEENEIPNSTRKLMINTPFNDAENYEDGTIIDIRRERKYNYGIATVYLILFFIVASVFINQLIRFKNMNNIPNPKQEILLDNFIKEKLEEISLENKIFWERTSALQVEFLNKYTFELQKIDTKLQQLQYESEQNKISLAQDILEDKKNLYNKVMDDKEIFTVNEETINYMNYKFGTQLIKEWTSNTYNELPFNNVDSSDLLSPVYNWDNTMNWPCELEAGEGYCKIGIHFNQSMILNKILYNSFDIEEKIEVFKLDEETQQLEVINSFSTLTNTLDTEKCKRVLLFENGTNIEEVRNLIIKVYPKDKDSDYILVNSFIIN
ncbi:hypothetical protein ACO0SA_002403 [Hanseniaspora valbyensis]